MAFNFKKFFAGIRIVPKTSSTVDSKGEIEVIDASGKLNYHNGTTASPMLTETHSATVTNKGIDADTNTIANLEVDNLKAGVLNTDTGLSGASNTQIPSALAVKTYVDDSSGAVQDDVDDLITLTGVPANSTDLGTFTGMFIPDNSDIKEALQALETEADTVFADVADLVTLSGVPANSPDLGTFTGTTIPDDSDNKQAFQALETAHEAHVNDTTGAHAASAISVTPTGNLAADDVQEGLVELQGDIDTINTTLANKVTGPASATDEAVARFDLTTGKLIQNSVVTITDAGVAAGFTGITSSGTVNSTGTMTVSGVSTEGQSSDAATTGANATLSSPTTPVVRLTNASLSSIDMIASTTTGRILTIINHTGNTITINNNTGATAGQRILTGTKDALSLDDEASIVVKYDATESRWMVIGGSGSGGAGSLDTIFQLTGSDFSQWVSGDNTTFLGGGTLQGSFVQETAAPLHGVSSYKYTQAAGSLDDYLASPAKPVPLRFRGNQATLFFPYLYDGAAGEIHPVVWDATNNVELGSSVDTLQTTGTNTSVYKLNVQIPSTCTSIRVGFHVKVLNSGKILQFDDIQMSADATVYADIANITNWTSYTPTGSWVTNTTYTGKWRRVGENMEVQFKATLAGAPTATALLFDLPAGYTIDTTKLLIGATSITGIIGEGTVWDSSAAGGNPIFAEYQNDTNSIGAMVAQAAGTYVARAGVSSTVPFTFASGDTVTLSATVPIVGWTASNENIITQTETFSTDTAALAYAGSASYTLSTLSNAPVGTFITFTYAINTNTATQTTTAPTQTTSSMNTNGIQLFTRAYNAASTAGNPARVAIQIGKGFKGKTLDLYKSTGKATAGSIDFSSSVNTDAYGCAYKDYSESTGILIVDAGFNFSSANTAHEYLFSDLTTATNGYLVINASKNPSLVGITSGIYAARAVDTSGTSIANTGDTKISLDSSASIASNLAVDSVNDRITATATGIYEVFGAIQFSSQLYAAGNAAELRVYKNGVYYSTIGRTVTEVAASQIIGVNGKDMIQMSSGDYIEFFANNNRTAGATALLTTAGANFFNLNKLGGL